MKNIFILLMVFALLVSPVQSQFIEIQFLSEKPYLVAGDQNVSIGILLLNKSNVDLEDIHAQLLLSYPFSPSVATSPTLRSDIFNMRNLDRNSSTKILFKIDVDKGARYGDYEIPLMVDYTIDTLPYKETSAIRLHIVGETLLDVVEVRTEKSVEVGHEFKIEMKIRNVGQNAIEWLKVSLTLDRNSSVISEESSELIFRNLKSGGTVTALFTLTTKRDISPDNYLLPMVLTYQDEAGQVHESSETLGITVLGKAEVDIAGIKMTPEQVRAGDRVTLAIQLDNTGTGDARAVSGTLSFSSLTLQSYSGEIKRGDSGALFFSFPVPKDATLDVPYTLSIAYEDDFGAHAFDTPGKLNLEQGGGTEGTPVYGAIVAIVLLVVILAWLWRRRARK
jgi:hypothetical protein